MENQDRDKCSYFPMHKGIELLKQSENHPLLISFLVISEKREKLLLLLSGGPKTLSEIRDSLEVTSSGIIPEIRKLEEKMLIYQENREYVITDIGAVVAEFMCQLEWTLRIFSIDSKFWIEHNISGIPIEFRLRLHELGNYEIIRSTPNDIFRPHNEYLKNLLNARWMKAVSPVLHPKYPNYVIDLADRGVPVSIIATRELLGTLKEKYNDEMRKGLEYENTDINVCDENISLSFSVTDFFLSMRLFLKDGNYDFYQNILSFDKSAIRWGEDLFNYYARRSKKVRLEDI